MPQFQYFPHGILGLTGIVTPRSFGFVKRLADDVRQILVYVGMRAQPAAKEKPARLSWRRAVALCRTAERCRARDGVARRHGKSAPASPSGEASDDAVNYKAGKKDGYDA